MSEINVGGPVYANEYHRGMNLLQMYAGMAMEKYMEQGWYLNGPYSELSKKCFDIAQAMITEYEERIK
jgi:hypothetical protein